MARYTEPMNSVRMRFTMCFIRTVLMAFALCATAPAMAQHMLATPPADLLGGGPDAAFYRGNVSQTQKFRCDPLCYQKACSSGPDLGDIWHSPYSPGTNHTMCITRASNMCMEECGKSGKYTRQQCSTMCAQCVANMERQVRGECEESYYVKDEVFDSTINKPIGDAVCMVREVIRRQTPYKQITCSCPYSGGSVSQEYVTGTPVEISKVYTMAQDGCGCPRGTELTTDKSGRLSCPGQPDRTNWNSTVKQ